MTDRRAPRENGEPRIRGERARRTPAGDAAEPEAEAETEGDEAAVTETVPQDEETAAAEKARLATEEAEKARLATEEAEKARLGREADDPEPDINIVEMKKQRALADATKPIEAATDAIWSMDPDKIKARKAVEDAYRTAARRGTAEETAGELWLRYQKAEEKFKSAAADMLRSRALEWKVDKDKEAEDANLRESHLWRWIGTFLAPKSGPPQGPEKLQVRKILLERKQVAARLTDTLGKREGARQEAAEETKSWEKAFGRWSAPDKEIAALIASYFDRIDQLNADINTGNNRDQAIFSFWFEVAPIHLQLRDKKVDATNTPGVQMIRDALKEFPNLANNYKSGADRKDGSLYLLDPGPKDPPDPSPLADKRQKVLASWQLAAETQSHAEADYATRPDAAADLKPRHDKLKDDGWVKGTREALADPKKP